MHAHRENLIQPRFRGVGWLVRLLVKPVWLVRVYIRTCNYEDGDPYENATVAHEVEDGVIELKGLAKTPTRAQYRAVEQAFKGWVIRSRRFQRREV